MVALEDQITRNKLKSYVILLLVPIFFVAVALGIGYAWGDPFMGLIIGTGVALFYTLLTYSQGGELIVKSVGGVPADPQKHKRFIDLIDDLCIASGMSKPRLFVQLSSDINAFAAGKNPERAIVCITEGALLQLDKQELEGVLAHELSHIKNYDVRFMTILVALVGGIAILSQMFLRSLWFSSGNRRENGGGWLLIVGIALAILAPIFAMLVQLAFSRRREFLADASGAHMTRNPEGLASALAKIGKYNEGKIKASSAVAPLYISNPFGKDKVKALFSTHPPLRDRINRLRETQ